MLAGDVTFIVGNDVQPVPVVVTAVIKAPATLPEEPALRAEAQAALDAAALGADEAPELCTSAVLGADPAAPEFVPLDVAQAVDHTLWIAVRGAPGASPATLATVLRADGPLARHPLTLGFASALVYPTLEEVDPCAGLDEGPERARAARAGAAACGDDVVVAGPEAPGGVAGCRFDVALAGQLQGGHRGWPARVPTGCRCPRHHRGADT